MDRHTFQATSGHRRGVFWLMLAVFALTGSAEIRAGAQTNAAPAQITQPASSSTNAIAATNSSGMKSVSAISDLDREDKEMRAAFVCIPGHDGAVCNPAPLYAAKAELESKWDIQVGLFWLNSDSSDCSQLATQLSCPGVLVILKGGGRSPVRGSITESNLISAFYSAMAIGGCCPLGTDRP